MAHRIGPEGGAWPLIRAALARERHLQVMPGRVERDLEALVDLLRRTPGGVHTARAEVADLTARTLAVRAAVTRSVLQAGHGEVPPVDAARNKVLGTTLMQDIARRSDEHTSELQSLMRISYAVFCLKKKNKSKH